MSYSGIKYEALLVHSQVLNFFIVAVVIVGKVLPMLSLQIMIN